MADQFKRKTSDSLERHLKIECVDRLGRALTTKKRLKIIVGGRGSTKSTFVADVVIAKMAHGELWCCAREYQNSIDESVHRLILEEIDRIDIDGFTSDKNHIYHLSGGRNFYQGFARNATKVKSMLTGVNGLWIEEGEALSFTTLDTLTASLRLSAKDAQAVISGDDVKLPEIWITMNRGSRADPMAQRFLSRAEKSLARQGWYEDDYMLVIQVNYNDIPRSWWMASGLEIERADDETKMSKGQYRSKWLGDYWDDVENALIPVEWFDAAISAHEKLGFKGEGAIIAAHDPSDEGGDSKGYAVRHGSVVLDIREKTTGDVGEGLDWAIDRALNDGADWFVWDCDGMGVSLKREVDRALDGKRIDYFMFKGSESPEDPNLNYNDSDSRDPSKRKTNKDTFTNKRAQYYFRLRDRLYNTWKAVTKGSYIDPDDMISLSSSIENMDQLRSEVCRIPLKRNNNGKIQIMTKLEMSKNPYNLPSPNLADSLMMAMFSPKSKTEVKDIQFDGW